MEIIVIAIAGGLAYLEGCVEMILRRVISTNRVFCNTYLSDISFFSLSKGEIYLLKDFHKIFIRISLKFIRGKVSSTNVRSAARNLRSLNTSNNTGNQSQLASNKIWQMFEQLYLANLYFVK